MINHGFFIHDIHVRAPYITNYDSISVALPLALVRATKGRRWILEIIMLAYTYRVFCFLAFRYIFTVYYISFNFKYIDALFLFRELYNIFYVK
jgi:hypothetical protein